MWVRNAGHFMMTSNTSERGANHAVQSWKHAEPCPAIDRLDTVGHTWLAEDRGFHLTMAVLHED